MGFFDGLSGLGSGLWQGTKNLGDFVGLDGSLGYQGTWNQPSLGSYLNGIDSAGAGANVINNGDAGATHSVFDNLKNINSQDLMHYGNAIKSIGGLGLGYLSYKNAKDMSKAYKDKVAFNEYQINRSNRRQEANDRALSNGFINSSLARGL